ncbi:Nucleolar protein 58 [Hondaea fermentalgiana]|uniref:Nucleolar protein 56 n=1 Tax=Hondaea fermentalgiana TaxID=2315210 RepID=A0A2R5G4L3_9STRA|nr:Nucleolar protein 58 [Hondaea fermentalgiana]|eukprot:GBG25967.1 Nucleolar protein 58 [Hondaea fermentalgiana]
MSSGLYLLLEAASGYGLFEVVEADEVALQKEQVQASVTELERFSKLVKLKAFQPFTTAENALENMMKVSENLVTEDLATFLTSNMPKSKKMKQEGMVLGVTAPNLASAIREETGIPCKADETVQELLRGVRTHLARYVKQLDGGASEKAQLGLGHSYSRAKVKFNVNRQDNMIIQSICLLDQMDKDINTCAMRVKEWYSWHFPELQKIVSDSFIFARLVQFITARSTLDDSKLDGLTEITMDEEISKQILDAARASMGFDCSDIDMLNLCQFADRVVELAKYRKELHTYLLEKMSIVAPNLAALIGEPVAARLISHAGSLVNLAKYPASTIQILGAEKALFRALKTKGNTPKYGLIFHSSFIGRAGAKNKGRISRYLANKCAIAARIDYFAEVPNPAYGEKLKEQVEERLAFYDTGATPKKNLDVMREAAKEAAALVKAINDANPNGSAATPKKRKRAADDEDEDSDEEVTAAPESSEDEDDEEEEAPKLKKEKKTKKSKKADDANGETPSKSAKKAKKEKKEKKEKKKKDDKPKKKKKKSE